MAGCRLMFVMTSHPQYLYATSHSIPLDSYVTPVLQTSTPKILLQDTSLETPGASVPMIQEEYGALVPRVSYIQHEKTLLCHVLLYATYLSPTVLEAATVAQMVDLIGHLAHRLKAAGGSLELLGLGTGWMCKQRFCLLGSSS